MCTECPPPIPEADESYTPSIDNLWLDDMNMSTEEAIFITELMRDTCRDPVIIEEFNEELRILRDRQFEEIFKLRDE